MPRKRILLPALVCLALACAASAFSAVPESPRFRLLGVAQGLPSSSVTAIARDRAGYVWAATIDGLARYDGVGFRVWRHMPDEPQGLPGNIVQALHVDARDRIWVATEFGGLSVLDAARGSFRHYRQATHPAIGSDDTWAIASRDDTVWFGTGGGGLHRLDATGRITRWTAAASGLPSDTVLALAFDADGVLWIGTEGGLARFDGTRIVSVDLPGDAPASLVYSLTPEHGTLWVGTAAGVWRRGRNGGWTRPAWSPMFERPNALMSIARDRDGALWIGSQRGLWRAPAGVTPVPVATGGPGMAKPVQSLLLQDDDALWTPVAGAGLGFLRSDWRRVAQFTRGPAGLSAQLYQALAPARGGGVWLGGVDGALERIADDGTISRIGGAVRARLKDLRLLAIAEDPGGRLWVGHRDGLLRIGGGVVDAWTAADAVDPLLPGRVDQVRVAPDGTVWLSSQAGGVQRRDAATGRVLDQVLAGADGGLGAGDTEALEFAPDGAAWIAGGNGLARWDRARRCFTAVAAMGSERVHAFAFDGSVLWLHRVSGLERYEHDAAGWRRTAQVPSSRGLPAVESAGLRVDRAHRVWLSTSRGLYRWDPARRNLRRFGVQHGLGSQEFLDRALALSASGTIAASTADGAVVLVDAQADDAPAVTPGLRFDSFAVRQEGRWREWPRERAIRLAPMDREFRVRARLLAYDAPLDNAYWTRLEGFDRDWVTQDASGERVFTSLAPGAYSLRVRAVDAAGNPAREQRLRFRVLPPWWRTSVAKVGGLLLCALLFWSGFRTYDARRERAHAMQLAEQRRRLAEQASDAKTRFLATFGHEVRTPMTGVLGMTELLLGTALENGQRNHVESIGCAGRHLLRLVDDTLDLARIEAGKLRLEAFPFDLRGLLQETCDLLAPQARRKGLRFECAIASDLPRHVLGDIHRVRQILLNLGNNAIKFTERGGVVLRGARSPGTGIRLVVADTGPGLDTAQQARLFQRFEQGEGARTAARYGGSGLGLAICRELAMAMGGRITVDSAPGQGAAFRVDLPLDEVHMETASSSVVPGAAVPLRVLVVEDDAIVARVLCGLLEGHGHRVTHVGQGLSALAALQSTPHDLALVDLDLPGLDGCALARLLRQHGHTLALVAMTAGTDPDAEPRARAAGMVGFLRKPLTAAALVAAVAAATAA